MNTRESFTRLGSLLLVAILAGGCHDQTPTAPDADVAARASPEASISDGAHAGNPHFFFLPPMVPDPSAAFTDAPFDGSLEPVVEICAKDGGGCAAVQPDGFPIEFSMLTGPGSETVRVVPEDEHYIVNWHTDEFGLDPATTYRIRVSVADTELGYADVDVASSNQELRNHDTGESIPLLDGRTLPIKFRIEQGAVFVVGPGGGTITAADGAVELLVPAGALEEDVGIVVLSTPYADVPHDVGLIPGAIFNFQPDGLTFAGPAELTIGYDEESLPAGFDEATLTLLEEEAGIWYEVAAPVVDIVANTVTAAVDGFSGKGIGQAVFVELTPTEAGLWVNETVQLTAAVTNSAGNPTNRPVEWLSSDDGVATVDNAGLVTAVSAGAALITAQAGESQAQTQITVYPLASWITMAPMPTPRKYPGVGTVDGILYVVGGVNASGILGTVEAYDPATNTWTTKASLLTARNGPGVAVVNGILYAVGGRTPSGWIGTVEAYDPVTDSWTPRTLMPTPRSHMATGVVNGIIYVAGGNGPPSMPTCNQVWVCGTLEAYDPATDTWTSKASLSTPRYATAGGAVDGLFYVTGGLYSHGMGTTWLKSVEAYDPTTNTWTSKAPTQTIRGRHGAAVVDGVLYVVAGSWRDTAERYDPVSNTWTYIASMAGVRETLTAGVVNGVLYAVGGTPSLYEPALGTVEAYHP